MINKLNIQTQKNTNYNTAKPKLINDKNKNVSFKGGAGDLLTGFLQSCDKYPIWGISFIDTVSTNIPRTLVDLKTTGIPAAVETARREFSGLLIDCLLPGFVVIGAAGCINNLYMNKFKNESNKPIDMSSVWANEASINRFKDIYKKAVNNNIRNNNNNDEIIKGYVKNTLDSISALNNNKWIEYKNIDTKIYNEVCNKLVCLIKNDNMKSNETKKELNNIYKSIIETTKAGEKLKFGDELHSSNLSTVLRDMVELGRRFKNKSVSENIDDFAKKAISMTNCKSLIGLGIIIPLAMAIQAINRALTRKKYNVEGAPIYKDFEKGNTHKKLEGKDAFKFNLQKILASAALVGLGILSLGGRKPNLQMCQFNGLFPTVDQCRIISVVTFVSRLFAAEDENELRESLIRDAASFAGLYFLGDYVAKIAASTIEAIKPDVHLLNRSYDVDKASKNIFKRFSNWVTKTHLKSFDEAQKGLPKNLRSICQVANIGFSILTLGVLLPFYNRKVTQKREKEKFENNSLDKIL